MARCCFWLARVHSGLAVEIETLQTIRPSAATRATAAAAARSTDTTARAAASSSIAASGGQCAVRVRAVRETVTVVVHRIAAIALGLDPRGADAARPANLPGAHRVGAHRVGAVGVAIAVVVRSVAAELDAKPTPLGGETHGITSEGKPPLAQSNPILQLLGTLHGLLPSDAWEAARHSAVMCSVEEMRARLHARRFRGPFDGEQVTCSVQDPFFTPLASSETASGPAPGLLSPRAPGND